MVLKRPPGLLVGPDDGGNGTGVLVLAGSSGRVDVDRARLLAHAGVTAMSIRWFGGDGQPPGICEVPLETFRAALDQLGEHCSRLVAIGTSKGAEAALLIAAAEARVDAVVAFAPSHVVWFNVGPGVDGKSRPARSSWTRHGEPLPFVPPDDDACADLGDPPAFRGLYNQSLTTFAVEVPAATIPVEGITGDVVLVAGEDDQVWASADFARAIVARRELYGLPTTLVTHPEAGHRAVLPGEPAPAGGLRMRRGGTPEADTALGRLAWAELVRVLGLPADPAALGGKPTLSG